ncbi:MAG TPA: serine hydrolase [Candidatus Sulfomarinibacteraceae bacterium]|nr:serine hydrolase [Candidatus Sulfomarinibacteraceae bacterium]
MTDRSTPGLGQWLVMTIIVTSIVFLLYKVYQYGTVRQYMPAGLTIAGVEVGGMTASEAEAQVSNRYGADVLIYHGENSIAVSPDDIEFMLDLQAMMNEADYQRSQQDFWAGFWGFLWNRPIEVDMVELRASHDEDALERVVETVAGGFDTATQPPQPVPTTLTFQYGEAGMETDIPASVGDVRAAFYRPTGREAHLSLRPVQAERPDMGLLGRLILNHLQEQAFSGVASIFILDLQSGEEVQVDANAPVSGMDLLKVPIVLDTYRMLDNSPSQTQMQHITRTLLTTEPEPPNALLNVIAGQDNPFLGAQIMTESMWRLGLRNTFIAIPYGEGPVPGGRTTYETPANTSVSLRTQPSPSMQTTAEDMGALLAMLYYCAEGAGGPLRAAYPETITPDECQEILDVMATNQIGSLIEEGVPPGTRVAHRHAWIGDTHADAGIVYSPGGDYVLVEILYQNEWLPWERSSPLMADIARATYNYFNFDSPYVESSRAN